MVQAIHPEGHINPTTKSFLDTEFFDFVGSQKVTKMIGTGGINARGGAICSSATNTISNCTFNWNISAEGAAATAGDEGNSTPSSGDGGAVYLGSGQVIDCTFLGNVSSDTGGALTTGGGTVTGSTFTRNWTTWRGGAISAGGATVRNCTLTENVTGGIQTRNLFSNLAIDPIWPASHPYEVAGCGAERESKRQQSADIGRSRLEGPE